jgi:hypothetical protein
MLRGLFFIIIGLGIVGIAAAQSGLKDCPALVEEALVAVGEQCNGLGRNEVCYGSNRVLAFGMDAEPLTSFATTGDIEKVTSVGSLITAGLDVEKQIWGVAVMSLQANLPDTMPGQNVTFLVFGDSTITAMPEDADETLTAPMQAFRITTGIGQPACAEAPRDGILVQSPGGAKVNFRVNGIDIQMGSTVLLDVRLDEKVWVSTLEGEATVTSNGVTETALPGYKVVTIPGKTPGAAEPYTYAEVAAMPVGLLPDSVAIPFIVPVAEGVENWLESDFAVKAGKTYILKAAEYDPQDALDGVLLARVGESDSFEVTDGMDFTPAEDGVLQFSIESDAQPEKTAFIVVVEAE